MDADIDPSSFDLVVVGTGLPESIIAGAAAQAGKTVLHLDPADNYGSHWATLQLDTFVEWAKRGGATAPLKYGSDGPDSGTNPTQAPTASACPTMESELEVVPLAASAPIFSDFALQVGDAATHLANCVLPPGVEAPKKYGVDLAGPRLALASGAVIDLLIQCGAHNYLEFKAVEGSFTWRNGQLEPVPSSRADVFKSRSLSLVEKRHLTKFFKLVTESNIERDPSDGGDSVSEEDLDMAFGALLTKHNLPPSIRQSLLYSVALLTHDQDSGPAVTAREGLRAITAYLHSVGRFGPGVGAFLYPLYGSGELPQAFCRIAAVKGALYVLRRGVRALLLDKASRRLRGVVTTTGQSLRTSKLVSGPGLLESLPKAETQAESLGTIPLELYNGTTTPSEERFIARFVCITDTPLTPGQSNILVTFPSGSLSMALPAHPVRVFQAGESAAVAPAGRFLVQVSTIGSEGRSAREDLQPVAEALFETRGDADEESGQGEEASNRALEATDEQGASRGTREAGGVGERIEQTGSDTAGNGGRPAEENGSFSSGLGAASPEPNSGPTPSPFNADVPGSGVAAEAGISGTDGQQVRTVDGANSDGAAAQTSEFRKPRLLWCVYFKQRVAAGQELAEGDIYVCGSPDESLTYGHVAEEAETAFKRLFPDLPYYPPQAPEPEEAPDEDEAAE
ncbi:rab GDP dissociation inhibito [Klebsormidium nitens]|uniref:Rab GDP dissociation inhibito n=1 Tax=Klebsormidium nitens TaxID=105231 RepID=A0A1Y1ICD1_KLENI|nr:rab GDP dissociation inhibito [Klebsormidium nitens]|eukprot:GAQ88243.1 rab GDP dissociation inhibito [Klebsormidium nitens]